MRLEVMAITVRRLKRAKARSWTARAVTVSPVIRVRSRDSFAFAARSQAPRVTIAAQADSPDQQTDAARLPETHRALQPTLRRPTVETATLSGGRARLKRDQR